LPIFCGSTIARAARADLRRLGRLLDLGFALARRIGVDHRGRNRLRLAVAAGAGARTRLLECFPAQVCVVGIGLKVRAQVNVRVLLGEAPSGKELHRAVVLGIGVGHQDADAVNLDHGFDQSVHEPGGHIAPAPARMDAHPDDIAIVPGRAGFRHDVPRTKPTMRRELSFCSRSSAR
jgi:hypothetical protein